MAKNNNLTDLLTDVADAIREKKGTTDPINPQDFSAEIASISSGAEAKPLNDVNFFDYDGTILHSFTAAEFLALSAMPPLPTQEGLICQEWNWTYEAAREYVEEFGLCDIGATYITDDGKTRIYIHIEEEGRRSIQLAFRQSKSNGVVIDWGDGSATETYASKIFYPTHDYAHGGDYCISLSPKTGTTFKLGTGSDNLAYDKDYFSSMITRIHIGKNVQELYPFERFQTLELITIPNTTSMPYSAYFSSCVSLRFVVIPSNIVSIRDNTFQGCLVKYISLPNGISSIGYNSFGNCYRLSRCILPKTVTAIGRRAFYDSGSIRQMTIPGGVSVIDEDTFYNSGLTTIILSEGLNRICEGAFYNCKSLLYVKFPSSISQIDYTAFGYTGVLYYDFRNATSIPTAGEWVFDGRESDCKIIVPDALYDSWITETNWATYADIIVKASEYNG